MCVVAAACAVGKILIAGVRAKSACSWGPHGTVNRDHIGSSRDSQASLPISRTLRASRRAVVLWCVTPGSVELRKHYNLTVRFFDEHHPSSHRRPILKVSAFLANFSQLPAYFWTRPHLPSYGDLVTGFFFLLD